MNELHKKLDFIAKCLLSKEEKKEYFKIDLQASKIELENLKKTLNNKPKQKSWYGLEVLEMMGK